MWEAIRRHLIKKGFDRAWIRKKNGKCGLNGYAYNDGIDPDGVLPMLRDGKWGFYDEAGEYIAPQFNELSIHSEDFLRVRINDTWG